MKDITETRKKLNETARVVGNRIYSGLGDRLAKPIYPPVELSETHKEHYVGKWVKFKRIKNRLIGGGIGLSLTSLFIGTAFSIKDTFNSFPSQLDKRLEVIETAKKYNDAKNAQKLLKTELESIRLPTYTSNDLKPFFDSLYKERINRQLNLEGALSVLGNDILHIEKDLSERRAVASAYISSQITNDILMSNAGLFCFIALCGLNKLIRNYVSYRLTGHGEQNTTILTNYEMVHEVNKERQEKIK